MRSKASENVGNNMRLHGNTTLTSYGFQGEVYLTVTDEFTLGLDPQGRWLLISRSSIYADGVSAAGCDGRDVFVVQFANRWLKSKDNPELTPYVPFEQGLHLASISPGAYPHDLFPIVRFAWFALALGFGLGSPWNPSWPAPWMESRTDVLAYAFEARQDEPPPAGCYKQVSFLVRGETPEEYPSLEVPADQAAYLRRKTRLDRVKELKPSTLAARYQVLECKEYLGMTIPTKYKLDVFWPGGGVVEPQTTEISKTYEGQVTAVEPLPGPVEGRPKPVGAITVNDHRFAYSDERTALWGLRYRIADGKWKEREDAELQRGFDIMKRVSKRFQPELPSK